MLDCGRAGARAVVIYSVEGAAVRMMGNVSVHSTLVPAVMIDATLAKTILARLHDTARAEPLIATLRTARRSGGALSEKVSFNGLVGERSCSIYLGPKLAVTQPISNIHLFWDGVDVASFPKLLLHNT